VSQSADFLLVAKALIEPWTTTVSREGRVELDGEGGW
jgi:hypothetical protein